MYALCDALQQQSGDGAKNHVGAANGLISMIYT
jgi:hypothetical protein